MSDEPSAAPWRSSNEVVDAALRLVTSLARETVVNADGVSVTLERHGRLMTVAASDDEVLEMDGHQYATGQGPCLSAKAEGRSFYVESLADETRWPDFIPLAAEQGIHSILSSPLITAGEPLGALNIYSSTERAFGDYEHKLATLFATQASEILTSAQAHVGDEQATKQYTDALLSRQTIDQAKGVLMERRQITAEAASSILRNTARDMKTTVLQYANEILASLAGGDSEPSSGS